MKKVLLGISLVSAVFVGACSNKSNDRGAARTESSGAPSRQAGATADRYPSSSSDPYGGGLTTGDDATGAGARGTMGTGAGSTGSRRNDRSGSSDMDDDSSSAGSDMDTTGTTSGTGTGTGTGSSSGTGTTSDTSSSADDSGSGSTSDDIERVGGMDADNALRQSIMDKLRASDKDAELADRIEILVSSTTVTLNGDVDSSAQKKRIEKLVRGVSGVEKVENNLKVKKSSR